MKKFLVLYMANGAAFEQMMKNSTPEQQKKGMEAWMKWMGDHQASLVDGGAPLGKTKRVNSKGASDTKNDVGGYSVVQAEIGRRGDRDFRQGPPTSANARRLGGNHRDHADTGDVNLTSAEAQSALHPDHEVDHAPGDPRVGRLKQHLNRRYPPLLEHWPQLRERIEALAAMIMPHAARADPAERQVVLGDVHDRVVDRRRRPTSRAEDVEIARRGVVGEGIDRERPVACIDASTTSCGSS